MLIFFILAMLSVVQFALRKQRMPVWTQKAKVLFSCALLLDLIIVILPFISSSDDQLSQFLLLPVLPLLQPLLLAVAWMVFWPLDHQLKRRIIDAARRIRERNPELYVIGITGSVGKTTTKELLGHVLQDRHPLVTPEHVNSEVGVAQWMIHELPRYAALQQGKGILIVEMGAYRKGEISLMSSYVQQTIGVVTYVGNQHLALFGSQEVLRDAKAEIITSLPPQGHAFLNGDNELSRSIREKSPCPVTIVGTGGSADLEAYDVEETRTGIACTIEGTRYDVPLHGTHNVTNVLLTVAIARHLGLPPEAIKKHLKTFTPPERTFGVREERGVHILDDTHNTSAASFKAAIAWARSQPYERKTLLTSGLIELGEEQERTERALGALAAPVFGRVIFTKSSSIGAFGDGYGKSIEALHASTTPVTSGSLLVCVGRMRPTTIKSLLPIPSSPFPIP